MKEYGKARKINNDYYEVEYIEYRDDGSVRFVGTEDFSRKRLRTLAYYSIHIPTGKLNKGNKMIWEQKGFVKSNSCSDAKFIAKLHYGENVQLRRI